VNVLNVRGFLGSTALCRAARRGHVDVLKLLIQAGADMDIPNDKMQYPLHFAAFKENEECVNVLLESGANLNSLDRKGRVPAQDTKNEHIRDIILAAMKQ
jgi:ankyrin repeat protein